MDKLTWTISVADLMDWKEGTFADEESAEAFLNDNRNVISELVTERIYAVMEELLP